MRTTGGPDEPAGALCDPVLAETVEPSDEINKRDAGERLFEVGANPALGVVEAQELSEDRALGLLDGRRSGNNTLVAHGKKTLFLLVPAAGT